MERQGRIDSAVKSLAEIARVTGAQICVENLHSANLCCTPKEHVDIIDRINEENKGLDGVLPVGGVVDIGHCGNGVKPEDEILALGNRLFGLHISDRHVEKDYEYGNTLKELLTIVFTIPFIILILMLPMIPILIYLKKP